MSTSCKVAWTYHTGDVRGPNDPGEATYEVTPLMIDDTVYICTPHNLVIALDAVTGKEKWRFDPHLKQTVQADDAASDLPRRLLFRRLGALRAPRTAGDRPPAPAPAATLAARRRAARRRRAPPK